MSLPPNRLHVLANHLQVSRLHVGKVGSYDEHLAGEAKREVRLVLEADTEVERSVLNGMADEVYDLSVDLGIALAELFLELLDVLPNLPTFFGRNRSNGRASDPNDLRFLMLALFSHGSSLAPHSWRSQWA